MPAASRDARIVLIAAAFRAAVADPAVGTSAMVVPATLRRWTSSTLAVAAVDFGLDRETDDLITGGGGRDLFGGVVPETGSPAAKAWVLAWVVASRSNTPVRAPAKVSPSAAVTAATTNRAPIR